MATHSYIKNDEPLVQQDDAYGPNGYGHYSDNGGQQLWDKFIKVNPRIFLVVCGHWICTPTSAYSTGVNLTGRNVHQLFCNHQCEPNGGNGYLMLLKFRPSLDKIEVRTYSPYLLTDDPTGAYTIPYKFTR